MTAAYDIYDYPFYWRGREYEHHAEIQAISAFLKKIPKIKNILEIGAGFGRLTPFYLYRAKKVILTDPSSRLLKLARERFKDEAPLANASGIFGPTPKAMADGVSARSIGAKSAEAKNSSHSSSNLRPRFSAKADKKIKYIQASLDNLLGKINANSINLIILVRVLHHIQNLDEAFLITKKLLKKKGYIILEFPNKCHFKARVTEFFHGNFTFSIDISPKDIRSKKAKSEGTLPFINYHPDYIKQKLEVFGFEIIETRSVSNVRSSFLKKIIPLETLLFLEKHLQRPFARFTFGPSIFILAQKKG